MLHRGNFIRRLRNSGQHDLPSQLRTADQVAAGPAPVGACASPPIRQPPSGLSRRSLSRGTLSRRPTLMSQQVPIRKQKIGTTRVHQSGIADPPCSWSPVQHFPPHLLRFADGVPLDDGPGCLPTLKIWNLGARVEHIHWFMSRNSSSRSKLELNCPTSSIGKPCRQTFGSELNVVDFTGDSADDSAHHEGGTRTAVCPS
jgi:hypothetical protein